MQHAPAHANANATRTNPCTDTLTEREYLAHMIPHHQVAVDMSHKLVQSRIRNPAMLHVCRKIIRTQNYEMWEMTMMERRLSGTLFNSDPGNRNRPKTKLEMYNPFVGDAKCNPLFFKPDDHRRHMQDMDITETSYLEHMIPHHQVAIDMSKRLLLHTNHSYAMAFCRKLIIDQQYEIVQMRNLLQNKYHHESILLAASPPATANSGGVVGIRRMGGWEGGVGGCH
jgi:uncharacterized protein (DUF305 family)